jgi:hypothetical protein
LGKSIVVFYLTYFNNNNIFPRDMVCLGNICINTLHKGAKNDDDDDNNNNNNNNKYVSNIPGNHEVRELQKTAILGTAHILRKVLMYS